MSDDVKALRDLQPGAEIDGFRLEELLHRGGMAILWRVSRTDIPGRALMKIPMIGEGDEATSIVGFEMEQMIMPRLTGPHVPRFYGSGDFSRLPYIVMEQIAGRTMLAAAGKLPMDPEEAARMVGRVAAGLVDLHRQKVIHFDLKPANVMFRDSNGDAVFIDFGLSRHAALPDLVAEELRIPIGTAPYIAPEQVLRNRTDLRSDIYSLGAVLYELVTGETPFGAPDTTTGMKRRIWRDPIPPRGHNAKVPDWLQEIILRCLEPDPNKRYPTAAQLAFDLTHPDKVTLTERATKTERDGFLKTWRRRSRPIPKELVRHAPPEGINTAPIVMVAVDLSPGHEPLAEAVLATVERILATSPDSRLACVNVLKTSLIAVDDSVDSTGRNIHVRHLAELKHWARPLGRSGERVTYHVLEGLDPAELLIGFARDNQVDHLIMGARGSGAVRRYLGSVSTQVVAEAPCTVTVVRLPEPKA